MPAYDNPIYINILIVLCRFKDRSVIIFDVFCVTRWCWLLTWFMNQTSLIERLIPPQNCLKVSLDLPRGIQPWTIFFLLRIWSNRVYSKHASKKGSQYDHSLKTRNKYTQWQISPMWPLSKFSERNRLRAFYVDFIKSTKSFLFCQSLGEGWVQLIVSACSDLFTQ